MFDIEQIKHARAITVKDIKITELSQGIYDVYTEVKNEYKQYNYNKGINIVKIKNLESNEFDDIIKIKFSFSLEEVEQEKQKMIKMFTSYTDKETKQTVLSNLTPTSVLFNKIQSEFYTLYDNNKIEMIMFILVKLPNSFAYDQLKEMEFEELNKIHSNLVKYLKTT